MISSEDDVFSSPDPPIVDCDVLEAAKENVQPLGTGRRVTALSAILSAPHAHREAKLQLTRNRLRMNVELALASTSSQSDEMQDLEIPNPSNALDAYWNFVSWTIDNYPQGHSAESGLLELLEEATRILKDHDDGKWRKDVKYLKLWLLYASYVEKPVVIYKFLVANEIGTIWALLYEEYAAVLERDGRWVGFDLHLLHLKSDRAALDVKKQMKHIVSVLLAVQSRPSTFKNDTMIFKNV